MPTPSRPPEPTPGEVRYRELTEPLLDRDGVERSTMMRFACVRVDGAFFVGVDHRDGSLLVKLPEDRVTELIDAGRATRFSPKTRPFREWASVPFAGARSWKRIIEEAYAFATG